MSRSALRERAEAGPHGDHAVAVRAVDWALTPIGPRETWPERTTAVVETLLRSQAPAISAWGPDGILIFNTAFASLLPAGGAGLLGRAARDACPALLDLVTAALADRSFAVAGRALGPGGLRLDLEASPVPGRDGTVLGALVLARVSAVPTDDPRPGLPRLTPRFEASWTAEADGALVAFSARWLALIGMAESDARGAGWLKAVHPEDRARTAAAWAAAVATGRPYEAEHRMRTGDGPYRWMRSRAQAVPATATAPLFWRGATEPLDRRQVVENRQSLLLDLADRFRNAADRREVATLATAVLGREIGAAHVAYADIEPVRHEAMIEAEWFADEPDAADLGRSAPLAVLCFGRASDVEAGMTIVGTAGTRIGLAVPLVRDGRLRALLHVVAEGPRSWSPEEVALVEDVSARTADALERIGAAVILRRNQARQSFLLVLGDRLRESNDIAEITEDTAAAVGRHLGASRAGYGEVEDGALAFATGWSDGSVAPLGGAVSLADLGTHADDLRRGLTTVFEAEAEDAAEARAIVRGLRTAVAVPLFRDGRLRAVLTLGRSDAHRWSAEEIALIGEVAARMWEALERARAEAALRDLNATLETRVEERTAELASSEARFRTLFENAPAAIVLIRVGPGGNAVYEAVNAEAERFMGRAAADLVDHRVADVGGPGDPLAERCRDCAATGLPVQYEASIATDGEMRTAEGVLAPIVLGDGADTMLIGISRDISAQRRAEDQLRQAQKMEAIGQLTGGIAHDFNNLLTGIIGSLALMQKRVAQGRTDTVERYAGLAMASANRAAALTHRLLAFSRRQPLEAKPVDANSLVSSMDDLLRRTMGEGIVIDSVEAQELWLTLCDPHQLENALLNLAINARDAMPDGGRLTVGTANAVLDGSTSAEPGDYVELFVGDTGTGMAPDVIARAFDPFFTTKPIGQGTGLGLSMIYGFVKQSGGHIGIDSELGRGTTVRIFLPRHRGAGEGRDVEPNEAAPRARDGETVLLVEDDATVRDLVREVLQDLGYTALEALDGPSGLAILETGRHIDLLVTDVGLPGMNGRQLAERARLSRPDLKVLFITGYAENAAFGSGHLDAGMQMMTKPFAVEVLAKRIRAMMVGP